MTIYPDKYIKIGGKIIRQPLIKTSTSTKRRTRKSYYLVQRIVATCPFPKSDLIRNHSSHRSQKKLDWPERPRSTVDEPTRNGSSLPVPSTSRSFLTIALLNLRKKQQLNYCFYWRFLIACSFLAYWTRLHLGGTDYQIWKHTRYWPEQVFLLRQVVLI